MMKIKYTLNSRYIYLLFIMKRWGQVETRAPLFSKENLRRLIVPLMIEQPLTVTVGMADTMMVSAAGRPPFPAFPWWITSICSSSTF